MGCTCCKSQQSLPLDSTITALLADNNITGTNSINPSLHVNTTTGEIKSDIIAIPKLIPNIRQLQSTIFQSLHTNEYDLYPKYGKLSSIWNASSIQEEKWDICHKLLQASLTIALYTNGANQALYTNMYNLLDYSIRINHDMILLPDLVQLIITFISGISLCDNIKDTHKRKQLHFSYSNNIVTFNNNSDDYLNIRSNEHLVGKTLINCHITSKGDEMWVGLVNKKVYGIENEIEKQFGGLLYYGGREQSIINKLEYSKWDNGFGAIHGFGGVLQTLEYYRSGDWISFLIDVNKNKPQCIIYKNGNKVFDINALPFKSERKMTKHSRSIMSNLINKAKGYMNNDILQNNDITDENEDDIYFCVVVDDYMDSFIVEEVLYTE